MSTSAFAGQANRGTTAHTPNRMHHSPSTPPGTPSLVARWSYDEVSGQTVADTRGRSQGEGTGLERGLAGISNDAGRSAAGDGSTSKTRVAHVPDYLLGSYTVCVYIQPDTIPAAGQNRIFFDKDTGKPAGGVSLEQYSDGGTSKLRAYTRDADGNAIWIGSTSGVENLPVSAAVMVALVVDPADGAPTRLYLKRTTGDAQLVASSSNTQGLQNNNSDIHHLMYQGTLAPFDGVIDRVEIYAGPLSQAEINALPSPISISHDVTPPNPDPDPDPEPEEPPVNPPPGGGSFVCLDRSTGTLDTSHKNLGKTYNVQRLGLGGNARYDLRGTICDNRYNDSTRTYDPSYNIRITATTNGGCAFGGTIINGYIGRGKYGARRYPQNHAGQFIFWDAAVRNFVIDSWRFHNCWDPIRTGPRDYVCQNITIKSCRSTNCFDDFVENDGWSTGATDGIVIDDCLVDGTFVFYSCRSGSGNPNGLTTIKNTLVRMEPFYDNYWVGQVFKLDGRSVEFDVENCIFHVGTPAPNNNPIKWENGDIFYDIGVKYRGKMRRSVNNWIVWVGGGQYPFSVPPGFQVTTNEGMWNNAKASWLQRNTQVPKLAGVD